MHDLPLILLVLPAFCLLLIGLLPSRWANRYVIGFRQFVTVLAGIQFVVAVAFAARLIAAGNLPRHVVLISGLDDFPVFASLHYDGLASLMLMLVSFVGWVICRYSIRYLDGEAAQGRYFRWTAFTIGAVCVLVVSGNLLMFFGAWVLTSLGLHQLLLHYAHRPAAQRAAWTKFTISRMGDLALVMALILTFAHFGTFEFDELFANASIKMQSTAVSVPASWIAWLIVLGAVTKSAQVPFHTWLPQTMETPTPVSALMHAGIVNAGGYLIIRTSPLVSQAPVALATLAIIGAVTACFAAVIMLTQTSVKRSLAYSTIAQMGFMMLQCGLGAFSAAMLHILAHSLYKAHAFLSSGGVLAQSAPTRGSQQASVRRSMRWAPLGFAATITVASYALATVILGIGPTTKPGGFLLGFVICLALTSWLWQVLSHADRETRAAALITTITLTWVYAGSFWVVDKIVGSSPAIANSSIAEQPWAFWIVATTVLIAFGSLFALHSMLRVRRNSHAMNMLYVHASNGFYVDAILRRTLGVSNAR